MVFRKAFDKDVQALTDGNLDASAEHSFLTQSYSKLKNISDESRKVLELEYRTLEAISGMVRSVERALSAVKAEYKGMGSLSKQQKRSYEEQVHALELTLQICVNHKDKFSTSLQSERAKIFEVWVSKFNA